MTKMQAGTDLLDDITAYICETKMKGKRAKRAEFVAATLLEATFPAITTLVETEAELQALEQIAVIGLALKDWERQNGRYPDALQVLIPEYISAVPIESFLRNYVCLFSP